MDYPVTAFEDDKALGGRLRGSLQGLVLEQEGLVNDLSSQINKLRRERDLGVSDTVDLFIACGTELWWAIHFYEEELKDATKANSITFVDTFERDLYFRPVIAYGVPAAVHLRRSDTFWWNQYDD
ncbi:hypothetical protein SEA_BIG4_167 [Microbacterium phage Big4]|nr:hypothetical protein SEA_BIG4_167 [Microbacterium phage Big4]